MTEKQQVAGTHYLAMAIQPRELAMHNHWDCDSFSCLKYLSRFRSKNGIEDLRKARHFAVMRQDFNPPALTIPPRIRISDYLSQNGFSNDIKLKYALLALWDTVYVAMGCKLYSDHLIAKIDDLIVHVDAAESGLDPAHASS